MEHCFLWEIPDKFTLINRDVSVNVRDKLTTNREGEKSSQTFRDIIEIPNENESNRISKGYQEQEFVLGAFYTIMDRTGYDEMSENETLVKLSSSLLHQVMQTSVKESGCQKEENSLKAFNWEIPDKFNMLDAEIHIKWETDKFLLKGEVGEINDITEQIILQKPESYNDISENATKKSFLHEVMHKIFFIAGDADMARDEPLVDLFAGCWNQIFNTGIIERK